MLRHRSFLLLCVASVMLGACAIRSWAPAPGKDPAALTADSGRCQLYAHGTEPSASFQAAGSARNVAIASGVILLLGGITTLAHDANTYNDCMEAAGWIPADSGQQVASLQAAPQPVTAAALPVLQAAPAAAGPMPLPVYAGTMPVAAMPASLVAMGAQVPDERTGAEVRAEQTAQAWLSAQHVLNAGPDVAKRSLYGALCGSGDRSACIMAEALSK
ncbi:MAG TPA: hypothetical protein VMU81_20420 [Acetobacteraceae bacterium]|nr:hypothetical protein [Acetobacteraceae bacterium]